MVQRGGLEQNCFKAMGKGAGALESFCGNSKRITSLEPFGLKFLSGVLRRPHFVVGEATIKAVAVNAWQWAEEDKAKRIQLHEVSYRNFKRGEFKYKEVQGKLDKLNNAKAPETVSIDGEE